MSGKAVLGDATWFLTVHDALVVYPGAVVDLASGEMWLPRGGCDDRTMQGVEMERPRDLDGSVVSLVRLVHLFRLILKEVLEPRVNSLESRVSGLGSKL